jgi:ADP-dependent NAD(P)H-hydrate dehydratase / NAD(P)H-hydrate epimerase
MLPVLTRQQMNEIDAETVQRLGIDSLRLMEQAATTIFDFIIEFFDGSPDGRRILIFCGRGNNGGDGAAVARMLSEQKASVTVVAIDWHRASDGDAKMNFERVKDLANENRLTLVELSTENPVDFEYMRSVISESELIVDSILGTGFDKELTDPMVELISCINRRNEMGSLHIPCLAIDIPSGLRSDSAWLTPFHVVADHTVTFTAPKLSNVMAPAHRSNGSLTVTDIGSPKNLIDGHMSSVFVSDSSDGRRWQKATAFSPDSFKNRRGHSVCFVGSSGYEGAAVLAANSAMMSGVGLVTALVPRETIGTIGARIVPEVMLRELDTGGELVSQIQEFTDKADSVLFGCGVGVSESSRNILEDVLEYSDCPVVIDADGLSLIAPFELEVKKRGNLILTPHAGEFRRLFGTDPGEAEKRIEQVGALSAHHGFILVLKGERTLIGLPNGRVVINPTGNSALGKAGNGDNLAGIVAGFVAQSNACGVEIEQAVVAAVYLAGLAGDIALERYGDRVLLASDVRDALADAFRLVDSD